MRSLTAAAVMVAAVAIPSTVGARTMSGGLIRVVPPGVAGHVSPNRAGARPVQLMLTFRSETQCGRIRSRSVSVVFPHAFSLPWRIAPGAVRVGLAIPVAVSVAHKAHRVLIALQPPHGISCESISPAGFVTVVFEKAANLGNPARAGRYLVAVTVGHERISVPLTIGCTRAAGGGADQGRRADVKRGRCREFEIAAVTGRSPALGLLTAKASPARHGARPAALTLSARFELQCGRVAGPLTVKLATAEHVPAKLGAAAVRVNGLKPVRVTVARHAVTLTMPRQKGMICDVIGPGKVTVRFLRSARLGNPRRAGSYRVSLRLRAVTVQGRLTVS